MKKQVLAMMMAGAMSVGTLAGCGGSDAGSAAPAAAGSASAASDSGGDYRISVILKTVSAEYWQYVKAGAEAYGKENGVEVDVKGPPSETSYDEHQNMVETDLASGSYDALVIAPLQSDQVATLISGTEVPIVALDTRIEAPEIVTFVGTGNVDAAAQGGAAAVEAAKKAGWDKIQAIEICGVQGDQTNSERFEGFQKGINEAGGEFLADEAQYADAVADKAVNCMEAIMQNHPDGVAIICSSNDDMVMAAARTAKDNAAWDNTIFCGFNGDRAACEAILAGEETMSVIQDAYGMGYKAVEAAVDSLNGKKLDSFIDSGSGIVDASNAQERLDELSALLKK